jgi:hypothetical protein
MQILGQSYRKRGYLLATGQVTSYGSGTGVDDGALQKGIVKAYTILTLGQYSGNTNITINGKTDVHASACVFDNNTGLMWSRTASASVGPASDGKLPWTTTGSGATAEGIFPYCAAANAAGLAGYADWRVPNINSIINLLDYEAPTALPDEIAFPTMPTNLWCSTTRPNSTANSLTCVLATGSFNTQSKTTVDFCILVRG